jgi:hypothetical protein
MASCGERDEGIPCGILLYLYAYNVDTDASLLEVDYAHKKHGAQQLSLRGNAILGNPSTKAGKPQGAS